MDRNNINNKNLNDSNILMVNDSDGNLDVIASIRNNVGVGDSRVINIKDIPSQFNSDIVKTKTSGVIRRVNSMINSSASSNGVSSVDNSIKKNLVSDKSKKDRINKIGIKELLSNKKFVLVVLVLVFVFTCITVGETFSLRNKVNDYDEFFDEIVEKEEKIARVYQAGKLTVDNGLNSGAALELVNCINSSIDVDNLPDSIESIIDEINSFYNKSNNYFAFKYKDIYTGFSISYNENQKIFAASTIKAPKDIYIYEMASIGKINLDEELTYTSGYYNNGTGVLKDKEVNTKYSVRTLVEYSTVHSDNAAHNMLMDEYGKNNMLAFWKEKGTNVIFTGYDNWGSINAHDASIYMEELYKFYLENEEYGKGLMNNFIGSTTKFITGKNNYKVANKSGWSGSAMHDVAIVFADNPYIVIGLSNLGETENYWEYFNKVNDLAYRLHSEYWKYKMDMCSDINQY